MPPLISLVTVDGLPMDELSLVLLWPTELSMACQLASLIWDDLRLALYK